MRHKTLLVAMCALLAAPGATLAQTDWTPHPDNPVIELGAPGSWDETGHVLGAVQFDGSQYHLWFQGHDLDDNREIGHATSPDGVVWTKDPANPVLARGASGQWDDGGLFGLGLLHDGTQFHMWYAAWGYQTGHWQGGYATSPDGTVWTKHPANPVMSTGPAGTWDSAWVHPHSVILEGGTFRMWYGGGDGVVEQIGYAESADGIMWTKHPNPVLVVARSPGAWDGSWVGNPYVVSDGTKYHMWYSAGGDDFSRAVGYAFSSDGVSWTKHAGNPVLGSAYAAPVWFDGSSYQMWYTRFAEFGARRIMYATSDSGPGAPFVDRQVLPAAAYAAGAQGSFYETTLELNNASYADAEYRFAWLPRGANNTDPVWSESFTAGPGESVRYSNVLAEVFNLAPGAFGALALESPNDGLMAIARIANTPQQPDAGSFGQPLDAIRTSDCTGPGEKRRLLFATEHADMRYNVGCFNASDEPAQVTLELHRSDGTLLTTESLALPPWGNDQLNRVFRPFLPAIGYVDYWSALSTGNVYCYGSVLDNVTSDPTTIPPL